MLPIVFLLIVGIYIFIERFITLRSAAKTDRSLLMQIRQNIVSGNLETALAICKNSNSPISRMLQVASRSESSTELDGVVVALARSHHTARPVGRRSPRHG